MASASPAATKVLFNRISHVPFLSVSATERTVNANPAGPNMMTVLSADGNRKFFQNLFEVHFLILSIIISSITVFMLLPLAAQYALNWALMSTRRSKIVVTNLYLRFRFLGYLLIFQLLHCF